MKIMKAIYRIITAATVASLALVSCSKELNPPDSAETGGLGEERVITLTFDDATKSQISGYHPTFKAGDKILLSNGTAKQECTVSVDTYGTATVTTTLTGTLKAVYPAGAAALSGNAITGVQVSSTQHGTFAEANIAMAEDIQPNGMARFKLKTAVLRFYVDSSIGVKSITITSGGADIATGFKTISVTPASPSTYLHQMTTGHPDSRLCYVAVLPGVAASDLTFTSDTESQGIVTRQSPGTGTLAVKGMYDAFIPYYIKIHIGPGVNDCQKWGYCNIGAFLPEEAGRYFAWGDVEGQTWNGSAWSGGGFSTAPDVGSPVPAELPLQYDAAYQNWGGAWRMPTGGTVANADFTTLANACESGGYSSGEFQPTVIAAEPASQGVYYYNVTGGEGVYFVDGSGNKLFFPAAGYGKDTTVRWSTNGYYWSSTWGITWGIAESADWAYYFFFASDVVKPQDNHLRYIGRTVRPIYKNPVDPLDIGEYDEPENIE